MIRVGALATTVILGSLAAVPFAQQSSQRPVPRFRGGVELVLLDVSVLDRDHIPVRGLTREDFTVFEDGKPQALETFTAIDLPDIVEQPSAPWTREVAPDVRRNDDVSDRRIVVIVIDDSTPMGGDDALRVETIARRVIENLQPDDLGAVVYTIDQRAGQEFTPDRARLLAAIARSRATGMPESLPGAADAAERALFSNIPMPIKTLRNVVECLEGMGNRRKAVFWISVGMPLDWSGAMMGEISLTNPGSATRSAGIQDAIIELRDMLAAAQRAHVTIYSLDPGGLRAPIAPVPAMGDTEADIRRKTLAGMNPNGFNTDFLRTVSNETGGFAVVDTNDPAPRIQQAMRENGSYYLLGYAPANARKDGRYRKIEVRVSRADVTVRTRSGYFEPRSNRKAGRVAPADAALAGILPKSDLAMQVTAAPFAVAGQRNAGVAVVLGVHTNAPMRATRVVQQIDLRVAAFGPDGRPHAARHDIVPITFNLPGMGGMLGYELLARLDLPPGRYQLRLAAESSLHGIQLAPTAPAVALLAPGQDIANRSGSVFCDLDVPDFAREPLSLSGLVLGVTPQVASGPKERLASLVPLVPTSLREFGSDDQVNAFLRVYQGGVDALAPVTLAVRILDDQNATAFEHSETLAPDRFATGRAADWWLSVPIARLQRGRHLLTVEARRGEAVVRRDVRFAVSH